jgi:hypothetical protein
MTVRKAAATNLRDSAELEHTRVLAHVHVRQAVRDQLQCISDQFIQAAASSSPIFWECKFTQLKCFSGVFPPDLSWPEGPPINIVFQVVTYDVSFLQEQPHAVSYVQLLRYHWCFYLHACMKECIVVHVHAWCVSVCASI